MNVLLCLIGFLFNFVFYIMNIHIYNLFYICTDTLACIMGFVPENKLIRIRIRIYT